MAIIAVATTKGGTGKTTTAYNIMIELNPDRVLDQDLHTGMRILAQMRERPLAISIEHYNTPAEMLNALEQYANLGYTVLVDVGGFDSDIGRAVCAVADLIISPCNDTPTDRIGLARFDAMLAEVSEEVGRHITAHALICKAHHSTKHFEKLDADLSKAAHITRMRSVICNRPDHYRSHERGLGVTELTATRHSEAGKEIIAVCDEIRELLAA